MKQETMSFITKEGLEKVCKSADISIKELSPMLRLTEDGLKLSLEMVWDVNSTHLSDVQKRDIAYFIEKLFKARSKEIEEELGIKGKVSGVSINLDEGTVDWTISYTIKQA